MATTTTTLRCPAEQAKAGIDQMLRLTSAALAHHDPMTWLRDTLLEMRAAVDATD